MFIIVLYFVLDSVWKLLGTLVFLQTTLLAIFYHLCFVFQKYTVYNLIGTMLLLFFHDFLQCVQVDLLFLKMDHWHFFIDPFPAGRPSYTH